VRNALYLARIGNTTEFGVLWVLILSELGDLENIKIIVRVVPFLSEARRVSPDPE
jgi:hypothetical protein